jgi:ABC-2 type transport system permease protein
MNRRAITAIVRKDLKVISTRRGVMIPLILVPLILLIALPSLVAFIPSFADSSQARFSGLDQIIQNMPEGFQSRLAGYNGNQRLVILVIVYLFAPMYLIIPLMVASVIAADSFAGEKERKTLEALIYTPTTDLELLTAKLLTAWLPAVVVSFFGFICYTLVANLAGWSTMGGWFFPNWMWVILALWVAPAAAGLGLSTMVIISAHASGFQDAYQIGGVVVLPILLLLIGQIAGVLYFSVSVTALIGLILWIIDLGLLLLGARTFKRSELIVQL